MARPNAWQKDHYQATCPLHIAWREDEIMCQSAMPESTVTIHRYPDKETAGKQKEIFCAGCYERCEHYRTWKHWMWEDE